MAAALALLSSVLWGAADFGGGLAAKRRSAVAVAGWSQAVALVALCVVLPFSGGTGGFAGWVGWSVAAGAAGAAGLVTFYTALATGTMGVVSPVAALGSVVVPVLYGLLTGDSPSRWQLLGIALGLAGVVAASGPELGAARARPGVAPGSGASPAARSVLLAAAAGVCFGFTLVGVQRGALTDPLLTLVGARVTSVTIFAAAALALRSVGGVRPPDLPALAGVGLADLGGNLLFALAGRHGMVSVVGVLGALYPVTTVLLGRVVLGERLLPIQRAGVVVALGGVILLAGG